MKFKLKNINIKFLSSMLVIGGVFIASNVGFNSSHSVCFAEIKNIVSNRDVEYIKEFEFKNPNGLEELQCLDKLGTILSYKDYHFSDLDGINYFNRLKKIRDALERKVSSIDPNNSNEEMNDMLRRYANNFAEKVAKIEALQRATNQNQVSGNENSQNVTPPVNLPVVGVNSAAIKEQSQPLNGQKLPESSNSLFGLNAPVVGVNSAAIKEQSQPLNGQKLPESSNNLFGLNAPVVGVNNVAIKEQSQPLNGQKLPESSNNLFGLNAPVVGVNNAAIKEQSQPLNGQKPSKCSGKLRSLSAPPTINNIKVISSSDVDKIRNCPFKTEHGENEKETFDLIDDIVSYSLKNLSKFNVNSNLSKLGKIVNIVDNKIAHNSRFSSGKEGAAARVVNDRLRVCSKYLKEKIKKIKKNRSFSEAKVSAANEQSQPLNNKKMLESSNNSFDLNTPTINNIKVISNFDVDKIRNCPFKTEYGENEKEAFDLISDIVSYSLKNLSKSNVNSNLNKLGKIANIVDDKIARNDRCSSGKKGAAARAVNDKLRVYSKYLKEKIRDIKKIRNFSEPKVSVVDEYKQPLNSQKSSKGFDKLRSLSAPSAINNIQIISNSDVDKIRNCPFKTEHGENEKETFDLIDDIISYSSRKFSEVNINSNLNKLEKIAKIIDNKIVRNDRFSSGKKGVAARVVNDRLRVYSKYLKEKIREIKKIKKTKKGSKRKADFS